MSKNNTKNRRQSQQCSTKQHGSNLRTLEGDLSLNAVNLLIERKVDEGVKELKKKFWPNTLILIVLGGVGIWGMFKGIVDDIQTRLTSKYVADTLNEHIAKFTDEKVAHVADGRIAIAEKRIIDGFEKKVAEQEAMLATASIEADAQIKSLQSTLDVMKKAYDASGGNRQAFDEIVSISTNGNDAGEIATKIIREIEATYSARKEKESIGFFGGVRHNVSYNGKNGKHGPITFADAAMLIMSHNRDFEEGAIYRLTDSGQKEFVEILMAAVLESPRLDSVYVALRGIEKLASASFPVLGVKEAEKWWEANKGQTEYHSHYQTVWSILLRGQIQIRSKETNADYYTRVVIPIHDAVVAKQDLENAAKIILPIAFGYGLELLGKMEGVDCLKITKDLISRLGNDAGSRRMAFRYTISTMVLYEKITGNTLSDFIIRSVKAHPDYLEEVKNQLCLTPEYKKFIETTAAILEEHTKDITFHCVMNKLNNGDMQFLSAISDKQETLHNLDLIARKDRTLLVHSANKIEIQLGGVGCIDFKTEHKEGRILLLNDNGTPVIFDVQISKDVSPAEQAK